MTIFSRKQPMFWVAAALFLVAVVVWFTPGGSGQCVASADSDINISDYCFRLDLTVTNNTGVDITSYPVRFELPVLSMINNNQLDARAWDLRPTQGGFGNEIQLFTINCDCNSSPWWAIVENLPDGESRVIRIYLGNNEQKRNQGMQFSDRETVVAAYDSAFAITNNLQVDVEVETSSEAGQNANLVDMWDSNTGYALSYIEDSGLLKVQAASNNASCEASWNTAWTDDNVLLTYRFTAASGLDLFIDANGVNIAACDTDEASLTIPSVALQVGNSLDNTIIRDVQIFNGGTRAAHWGFDFSAVTESSATTPYAGLVSDYTANNNDLVYSFSRDQAGLIVSEAGLVFTTDDASALYSDTGIDLLGNKFGSDMFAISPENQRGVGFDLFDAAFTNFNIPRAMGFAMFLSTFGLILAVGVFTTSRSVPLAIFAFAMPLTFGSINGWLPTWWVVLWALLFITAYGAQQWGEQT